jgi:hypothetical protein
MMDRPFLMHSLRFDDRKFPDSACYQYNEDNCITTTFTLPGITAALRVGYLGF